MKTLNVAVILAVVVLVFTTISCTNKDGSERRTGIDGRIRSGSDVLQVAKQVVETFKAQDGKKLAALAHPEKGVRFSPSAYVNVASDVVFSRPQIETFWTDEKTYTWGLADGTGDPINMTPSQYCREYIMNRDFLKPSSINFNNDQATGNTRNNAALIYPDGTRVEYYIKATAGEDQAELDWAALRLVFEKSGDFWFLVGVIHDQWTI